MHHPCAEKSALIAALITSIEFMRQMTLTGGTITFPTDLNIITDQREKKTSIAVF
ncbi:hypothetical protein GWA01_08960 [Gluconobacter wancherniae NBRC 103581]|uniref:Uncharacterized protein n=1 Tax=Gluconobacter wancherniae NBRC 103581 TaxID=656744 RepID=A0A511AY81_9PROT|nr:hypothetical protein GWA01_08960 [Gluconobacter wancherniae NBRC 103581]